MPKQGNHTVIIGGTKGLGYQIAKATVAAGSRVTITGRDETTAKARAHELGGLATGAACDLNDWDSIDRLFAGIDTVDHLVLTALDRDHNTIAEFRPDDCTQTMMMKTVGYATAVSKAVPKFSADSSVVLFSGLSMLRPVPGSTTLSMANAAILGLLNTLTVEIAPVRVNVITPGVVGGTDAVDKADPVRADWYEAMRQRTPAKRLPSPEDIVSAVFFLQDCQGVNGANLIVDAGMNLA
ncbi:NAD(P)-dependent dehydrogenase, short-chain alcohol dehydrogenase family [Sinosporangium album]|uniref:NAD(P)-dependent dehydrogenase, short-chain alcohol dehydrogenase family n=1 Tax=Sinosporangium album TaxID=504805 RepID=A0A1G8L9N8_9ACTN|nr:SDR family oxidoreductase [Sinosporangium album]SDI52342.1 NAD(P)-dependent dehydrogenase, short-chain alcohol dehydrogenase family [Sinosporangium album]